MIGLLIQATNAVVDSTDEALEEVGANLDAGAALDQQTLAARRKAFESAATRTVEEATVRSPEAMESVEGYWAAKAISAIVDLIVEESAANEGEAVGRAVLALMGEDDQETTYHYHHVFPKQYGYFLFRRYGLNVDEFTIRITSETHRLLHLKGDNAFEGGGWWNFMLLDAVRAAEVAKGALLTHDEVVATGRDFLVDRGLGSSPFVRYPRRSEWGVFNPNGAWLPGPGSPFFRFGGGDCR